MRKLREVMRLRFELHLGYQQIGRSCANRCEHGVQVPEASRSGGLNMAAA
jgi:hypothetical protein